MTPRHSYTKLENQLNSYDPVTGPTPYPLTEGDASNLRHHFTPAAFFSPQSTVKASCHWRVAVRFMQALNDPERPLSKKQLAALARLRDLGKQDHWRPDILPKIFFDVDILLFGGKLQNNVAIRWGVNPDFPAVAYVSPMCAPIPGGCTARPHICLNVPWVVNKDQTIYDLIQVLIHECCHAILMVLCVNSVNRLEGADIATVERNLPPEANAGHATAFQAVMASCQARLGRTRYCYMRIDAQQDGATVDRGTALGEYWNVAGGYRRIGKFPWNKTAKLERRLFKISREQDDALWSDDETPRDVRGDDEAAKAKRIKCKWNNEKIKRERAAMEAMMAQEMQLGIVGGMEGLGLGHGHGHGHGHGQSGGLAIPMHIPMPMPEQHGGMSALMPHPRMPRRGTSSPSSNTPPGTPGGFPGHGRGRLGHHGRR